MDRYTDRKTVILVIIICVCMVYIVRLFYMQVIDDSFQVKAVLNSQRVETQYPARGLIFDRNDKLLVENQPAYDLMVIPKQVKTFDTLELIRILGIEKETLLKNLEKCRRYSSYKASILISQITANKYAVLQEKLYKYQGFFMQTRTLRKYNVNHSADVFGYTGEVSQAKIDLDSSYALGDYIGVNGLEKTYENILRGKKGKKILLVDNFNRIKGVYKNGKYDQPAVVGSNLTTTLDIDLQEYAYQLMQNKKGGIIAIEPSTGEILLKVSSPGYDPRLMIGLERGKNYRKLQEDPGEPLFDRTVSGAYPPGSTFKTLQALYGLQENVIVPETLFKCIGKARTPVGNGLRMGCHNHPSPLNLREAIQHSCNPYFVNVWRRVLENHKYKSVRESYVNWREFICSFGLGSKVCPDFTNEINGLVPPPSLFDSKYRTKDWRWSYLMSLSIGQGELLLTPVQIANMVCVIANRGYYMTPHIVRPLPGMENTVEKHVVDCDLKNFNVVIDGMRMAATGGTARGASIDSIAICGKTGTAQNNGKDHSIFMAFAPMENPKIAIAVYIENGGFGARFAVPIGGLIMEKYLKGRIAAWKLPLEERMMHSSLIAPFPGEKLSLTAVKTEPKKSN